MTVAEIEVTPSRLVSGKWCHNRNREIGQGDINASYSADVIALEGRVRRPFRFQGWLRVCVGMQFFQGETMAEAYRLVPEAQFEGEAVSYKKRCFDGDDARRDSDGFYHGMKVKYGDNSYVLVGPPVKLVEGEPEPSQADLFA